MAEKKPIEILSPEAMAKWVCGGGNGPAAVAGWSAAEEAIRADRKQIVAKCVELAEAAEREAKAHEEQANGTTGRVAIDHVMRASR